MKKFLFLATLLSSIIRLQAQQVAINTDGSVSSDPKAMLEVKKNFYSKVKIRSMDHADTSVLELSNRTASNLGTDFLISARREQGFLFSSLSDLAPNNNDSLFSILTGGNAAIGVRFPTNRFQVHHGGSVNSYMNMTNSTTGYTGTDGLLMGMAGSSGLVANLENGNLRLATNNLTRIMIDAGGNVGVGNLSPLYKLDVNGDMNLTGAMRINGSAGTAGEVLTSNGTGDPQWKNTAYGNTTRFSLIGEEGATPNSNLNLSTVYNTNTADIVVGSTSFTVNRSGLYHIEGSADMEESFNPAPPSSPDFSMSYAITPGASNVVRLMFDALRLDDGVTAFQRYYFYRNFSTEVFITAGSTVSFVPTLLASTATLFLFNYNVRIRGHLISE